MFFLFVFCFLVATCRRFCFIVPYMLLLSNGNLTAGFQISFGFNLPKKDIPNPPPLDCGLSGVFVKRCGTGGLGALQERFQLADGFGTQQHVAAHVANFRRHMVNDDHLAGSAHGMGDGAQFVFARTILDAAFHSARAFAKSKFSTDKSSSKLSQ